MMYMESEMKCNYYKIGEHKYAQCEVIECVHNGKRCFVLRSYNTYVATVEEVENGKWKFSCICTYSPTTRKHLGYFSGALFGENMYMVFKAVANDKNHEPIVCDVELLKNPDLLSCNVPMKNYQ